MTPTAVAMALLLILFGGGSKIGSRFLWTVSSISGSLLATIFAYEGNAIELIVLKDVHDLHEIPIARTFVGADEDTDIFGFLAAKLEFEFRGWIYR